MKPIIVASVAERIKVAMEIRKMTQADICRITNIDKGSVSSYVSGRYEPKDDRIFLIATALNVNPSWLSGFAVPMETSRTETIDINEKEKELIIDFKSLSEEDKKKAIEYIKLLKKAAE